MVAWQKVTWSVELGDLGVLGLDALGHAHRLCWAWLRRTDPSRAWSALPANTDKAELTMFEASTSIVVGCVSITWFWRDKWMDGHSIESLAPVLISTVDKWAIRVCTVAQALQDNCWVNDISGSVSALGLQQTLMLWKQIHAISLVQSAPDRFLWKWSSSNQYSASSAYQVFFIGQSSILGAKELHKVRAPLINKLFVWLALLGHAGHSSSCNSAA
jgi:hypothetical protein